MPGIRFHCSNCNAKIEADESLGGGMAQCPNCESTILIPKPGIEPGLVIGGFKVDRLLGIGGMGEVWLAEQLSMQRQVALKIIPHAITRDQKSVDVFLNEARNTAKLEHPNIVRTLEAGFDAGIYFLAISYVEGTPLDRKLEQQGPCPEQRALEIVRVIARALKYAWENFGLLHLDIKPGNIIIDTSGKPVLTDMGLSKTIHDDPSLSSMSMIVGTPYYMSPEQAMAEEDIDFRADVYSLGATLFHLVTGEVPFDSNSSISILTMHLSEPVPEANVFNPEVSVRCAKLIDIMMSKEKDERYLTWDDLIRDIDSVLAGGFPGRPDVISRPVMDVSTATQTVMKKLVLDEPGQMAKLSRACYEYDMYAAEGIGLDDLLEPASRVEESNTEMDLGPSLRPPTSLTPPNPPRKSKKPRDSRSSDTKLRRPPIDADRRRSSRARTNASRDSSARVLLICIAIIACMLIVSTFLLMLLLQALDAQESSETANSRAHRQIKALHEELTALRDENESLNEQLDAARYSTDESTTNPRRMNNEAIEEAKNEAIWLNSQDFDLRFRDENPSIVLQNYRRLLPRYRGTGYEDRIRDYINRLKKDVKAFEKKNKNKKK